MLTEPMARTPGARTTAALLIVGLAVALLGFLGALPAESGVVAKGVALQGVAGTVKVLPASSSIAVGGTVTVYIWLQDVGDYYAVDVMMSFDPSVIHGASTVVTPIYDLFDEADSFIVKKSVNSSTGEVWYAITNTNPAEPFGGTGRICAITFVGMAGGTSPLDITYAKGSTIAGDGLFPAQMDGSITVQGAGATSTPTNTVVNTPTATNTVANTATATNTLVKTATATNTVVDTPTATQTIIPSLTPTASNTPTASGTATPTATPTQTPLPSITPTASNTPLASVTPTATRTPQTGTRTFSGRVYRGVQGDLSQPLAGASVLLYGSNDPNIVPGTWLATRTTLSDGLFSLTTVAAYYCYNIVEDNPAGYYSTGSAPGAGGATKGSDWIQYLNSGTGTHSGSAFFDLPEVVETATATTSPTPSITLTPTVSPTATETPQPVGTIDGVVWGDDDRNAAWNLGEGGLSGVTVALYRGGTLVATVVTNGSGFYSFGEQPYGAYQVQVTDTAGVLSGYDRTTPAGAMAVTLSPEHRAAAVLFGYAPPLGAGGALYLPLVCR